MKAEQYKVSTSKTLISIVIYFLLFLAGNLLVALLFDLLFSFIKLPSRELYVIIRMIGTLLLTFFLFWFYTTKVLRLKMKDFGIAFNVKKWGVLLSVLLPAFVVIAFIIIGKTEINSYSSGKIILIVIASMITALKAGILEEMLFRGFIMKLLENRWNKYIAILMPSFIFSLAHIPSMKAFSFGGVALLMISGTLAGVMFSLVAYKGNSIGNSALMHAVWNFVMVTDVLQIAAAPEASSETIFSVTVASDSLLLTGGGFGMEASLIAMIGYILICGYTILTREK